MNGLGNQMSGQSEREQSEAAKEKFLKKIQETGKIPGTHTLGAEFSTKPANDEVVRN